MNLTIHHRGNYKAFTREPGFSSSRLRRGSPPGLDGPIGVPRSPCRWQR
ncbi:MAG: hypothetical protein N2509_07340 [Treponemataceae bacterium]|nr:hypothetical protein [Treponemataceae bacterium]